MAMSAETKGATPRAHVRQKRLKDAKIVYNGGLIAIDCVVRDWSEGGARLKCSQAIPLPKHFHLLMRAEWLMYPVELRWRKFEDVGVMFKGPPEAPPMKRL
jgi:two-component system cell cycle response regulator